MISGLTFPQIIPFSLLLVFLLSSISCKKEPRYVGSYKQEIMRNEKDYAEMVLIPAGTFFMGSEDGNIDEKPVHKIYLDEFHIYTKPVSNRQYLKFITETGHAGPVNIEGKNSQFNLWQERNCPEEILNQPVINVSWYDAVKYAKWAGGDLPTEAEWEKAARGGLEQNTYSWGNDPPSSEKALFEKTWNRNETLKSAGTFPPNGYGLYDVTGTVWEWCKDFYKPDYYSESPDSFPCNSEKTENNVLRGGSWQSKVKYLKVSVRNASDPRFGHDNVGFRIVKRKR